MKKFNVSVFVNGVKDFKVEAANWEDARKLAEVEAGKVLAVVKGNFSVLAEDECDFDSLLLFDDDDVLECGLENPDICESCQ